MSETSFWMENSELSLSDWGEDPDPRRAEETDDRGASGGGNEGTDVCGVLGGLVELGSITNGGGS